MHPVTPGCGFTIEVNLDTGTGRRGADCFGSFRGGRVQAVITGIRDIPANKVSGAGCRINRGRLEMLQQGTDLAAGIIALEQVIGCMREA